MFVHFYPRGTEKSGKYPLVKLSGPDVWVDATIHLDDVEIVSKCQLTNLKNAGVHAKGLSPCKLEYRNLVVSINRAANPMLTWTLSDRA